MANARNPVKRDHRARFYPINARAGAEMKSSMAAALSSFSEHVSGKILRSVAHAGAEVLYKELKLRTPITKTGNLNAAIYQYFDKRRGTDHRNHRRQRIEYGLGRLARRHLRRFRKADLYVPRKNAKSTIAAVIGLYMLALDGEFGAEVYSGATSLAQARELLARVEEVGGEVGVAVGGHPGAFAVVAHVYRPDIPRVGQSAGDDPPVAARSKKPMRDEKRGVGWRPGRGVVDRVEHSVHRGFAPFPLAPSFRAGFAGLLASSDQGTGKAKGRPVK